jgi:hypothetical protein
VGVRDAGRGVVESRNLTLAHLHVKGTFRHLKPFYL